MKVMSLSFSGGSFSCVADLKPNSSVADKNSFFFKFKIIN